MTEAAGGLTILLVEDNPGDARYIREIFRDAGELTARTAGDADGDGSMAADGMAEPSVIHETRLADGLDQLSDAAVDVVLLDLNLPDSRGLETVKTFRERTASLPIVVLTGLQDRQLGLDALDGGADEYLVKDEINADLLLRSVYYAIDRKANQRELEQQRDQLATLHALNELVHEVSHLAIEASDRDELEGVVCDTLASSASYQLAWFGEADPDRGTVTVRTEAGPEALTGDVEIRLGATDGTDPTVRAFRDGEAQFLHDLGEESDDDGWPERAREAGIRSVAVIPITYERTPYGVLHVATERPHAFGEDERRVIARLGEIIGHAINAIQRKQALMSQDVVEVRFQVENLYDPLVGTAATGGTITLDRTVQLTAEEFLEYGTVTEEAVPALEQLVEELDHFEALTFLDEDGATRRFELRLTEPPVISAVASLGGRVEAAEITDGDLSVTVHVPPSVELSQVIEAVKEAYPAAVVVAQRQLTRTEGSARRMQSVMAEELTDKQRAAIESAYFSGFFDWPRASSGEDVADSIGISPSTFHQHVRKAEHKLFEALLDDEVP